MLGPESKSPISTAENVEFYYLAKKKTWKYLKAHDWSFCGLVNDWGYEVVGVISDPSPCLLWLKSWVWAWQFILFSVSEKLTFEV